jgi:thiol-disulfide isomerase/thioredoxin
MIKQNKYVIVNISATWCKPCMLLKPNLEKFITVIDESDFIYVKIDFDIYENDERFQEYFVVSKIPFFCFIDTETMKESFVNSDFTIVSKKVMEFISFSREKINNELSNLKINDDDF